jgi:hypothetical protein
MTLPKISHQERRTLRHLMLSQNQMPLQLRTALLEYCAARVPSLFSQMDLTSPLWSLLVGARAS